MKSHKRGYSLLMTLVALGIFAVGIAAILTVLPVGSESVRRTVFTSRASAIAEREMARIRVLYGREGVEPPARKSGQAGEGFSWEAKILPGEIYTIVLTVSREQGKETLSETFKGGFYPSGGLERE